MFPVCDPVALLLHRDPLIFQETEKHFRQTILCHCTRKRQAELSIVSYRPAFHPLLRRCTDEKLKILNILSQIFPDLCRADVGKGHRMGAACAKEDQFHRQMLDKQRDRPHIPLFLVGYIVGDRLLQSLLHDLFVHLTTDVCEDLPEVLRRPAFRPGDIDYRKKICERLRVKKAPQIDRKIERCRFFQVLPVRLCPDDRP